MPDDEGSQRPNGRDTQLVSAPDGKGHAMPLQTRHICTQHHIGGGIVRVTIHGIGTSQRTRRRETNVMDLDINNSERQSLLLLLDNCLTKPALQPNPSVATFFRKNSSLRP